MRIKNSCYLQFCSAYFSEQDSIFYNFFSKLLIDLILERQQLIFFGLQNLKKIEKNRRNGPIAKMFADSDSWRSNWPFPPVKFKKFDQSKIEKTTKTIVLCYFSGFDQKNFGLRFWIFHVSWVTRTSWKLIHGYFCSGNNYSIFFLALKNFECQDHD